MELDLDVYERLCKYGIIKTQSDHKIFYAQNKVVLDPQTSIFFENGVAVGRYLLMVNKIRA